METLSLLLGGLASSLTLGMLLAVFFGVIIGLFVGVLPGLGPAAGVAILLPVVIGFDGTQAIAALAGVYYGAMFGGAVTSILLGIPGDAPSVMTVVDGHPMAKKGQAGAALGMNIVGSFFGGLVGILLLTMLSYQVARAALSFGPAEMTALMALALSLVTVLGGSNAWKGFASLSLGLWIGMIGLDAIMGMPRFTFGSSHLLDGIEFSVIAVGLFGLGQMLAALGTPSNKDLAQTKFSFRSLMPNVWDVIKCRWDLLRGSIIGFVVGILPGVGATAATMLAYASAKRFSKTPERFGKGAIEGVAAPEAANNSASYASMIPLFTLGIPGSATTAVLMGGLLMVGLQPGPMLFQQNPDFIWTLFATFYIGNLALVFITLLLTPVLASTIFISKALLFPLVLSVVAFGIYSIGYSMNNLWVVIGFGILGYIMLKLDYPAVPLILGVVLGPMLERGIRRTLISSQGDVSIYLDRPIAMVLFGLTVLMLLFPLLKRLYQYALRRHGVV
ncbi:TctA subunit of the tripartite Tricarboxylate transport(TTT) family protein [Halomonas daqingensis]|uniref:TctA subunit of the tripartite Tricarboxylate transport(TTT) family protein n=1 Tax=Billgrantia desiderata TaxID=52021 RepID=A0ABS9B4V7_9GAMM|nr:tripartite tricarboxylate transporter permease [Halomonas desiderata]MCE8042343.1 TctA subunit of the tripartite Tricarboxylate transport(TTT) family protein [Halomonas desiderata]MCE8046918.1 TctA subunit of the tripartite Tricarboxylate transport(TTT) family protein [Halomonas desiderata]